MLKYGVATFVALTLMLALASVSEARGRGNCCCNGGTAAPMAQAAAPAPTTPPATAQAAPAGGTRSFSYQPTGQTYYSSGAYRGSNVRGQNWMLPKSDPRRMWP